MYFSFEEAGNLEHRTLNGAMSYSCFGGIEVGWENSNCFRSVIVIAIVIVITEPFQVLILVVGVFEIPRALVRTRKQLQFAFCVHRLIQYYPQVNRIRIVRVEGVGTQGLKREGVYLGGNERTRNMLFLFGAVSAKYRSWPANKAIHVWRARSRDSP